ncbi:xylan alpha-(1-_2)-glucuronosidase [Clostridium puniceum]|uniref:Xylan alpha-1,2-glucuronidase n=1 Tax=Clostridium puniceum TaxID=29367 RepID=A0A1S8TMW5_9CLOT|nr:alpha-glucuronidase family glycosyl hydrolase [Clostridium puniceum]OOM78775.1 xylan alpha-(1->2)-glucuronosidase [Clostridium puniceum]
MVNKKSNMYQNWLSHREIKKSCYKEYINNILVLNHSEIIESAVSELKNAFVQIQDENEIQNICEDEKEIEGNKFIKLYIEQNNKLINEGYKIEYIKTDDKRECIRICAKDDNGILYGVFTLLRLLGQNYDFKSKEIIDNPKKNIRIVNHWDNIDGTVERGFAGSSVLFESCRNKKIMKEVMNAIGGIAAANEVLRKAFNDKYKVADDLERINDYARMLSSVGINGIIINNTNVHKAETYLIDDKISIVKIISEIMQRWGVKTYLSINFASPITLGDLQTADPLDNEVIEWWRKKAEYVYSVLPNLGGFMVKADSEGRPGPFTYGRNHADGANMLASALSKYGGVLIWRCFVYNCRQDWRDYTIDRAKAAYDCFSPLDGHFLDNVYLQIKNGPMDFQVREPITPLFGAMNNTNKLMEFQITQEYTGQQKHVCFLIPWWKEILNQPTYGEDIKKEIIENFNLNLVNENNITNSSCMAKRINGIAAIVNIGNDENWTGHFLAQANIYGYGRLAWNSDISIKQIVEEWIKLTFGDNPLVMNNISEILMTSWETYEKYTSPLGIGWMVAPGHHYEPDVDGYEFSPWGTYHRADCNGIGIDRTFESGTGYTEQYNEPLKSLYNNLETCPDELLLFFHHVSYNHVLKSGKTVIQHIYDTHFEGYELVKEFIYKWEALKGLVDQDIYEQTLERLKIQLDSAENWKDQINTYFYRISGIEDEKGRKIY